MIHPYNGNEKFIFVSYAHKDKEKVLPIIEKLSNEYRVWFDEGIHFGSQWDVEIVEKLSSCSIFIFMVSPTSLASPNCQDELAFIRDSGKPFINIILDNFKLPDNFVFRYGRFQMCHLFKYNSIQEMISDLASRAPELEEVKNESSSKEETILPEVLNSKRSFDYKMQILSELTTKTGFVSHMRLLDVCNLWTKETIVELNNLKNPASKHDLISLSICLKNMSANYTKLRQVFFKANKPTLEIFIKELDKDLPIIIKAYADIDIYFTISLGDGELHDIFQSNEAYMSSLKHAINELNKMIDLILKSRK